ncbi:MAG: hypothetical protein HOI59_10615 [Nitrospina sp.]|jgi:hypothetical protein|nr:hypothetical protein [Nitrospina sp.]MBT3857927.1 hypothetical protein [Nitrospina sp.]MBT4103655.1 hypothetical protein [Nitrospina sp.]MBT4389835.1 hypothetical protein [Nitrospina sp.]MBT4621946.1 hypothetical protein [Nitrospina sp.]
MNLATKTIKAQTEKENDILLGGMAEKIKDKIFIPASTHKIKIFLCGASLELESSLRFKIDQLFKHYHFYQFEIIYPEDLFDELLFGPNKQDLLSLENLLAESVDAVIIIPESSGSFAELGAFVSNENLRKKIICLQDKKRVKEKSFINYGPIRLLKKLKQGKVIPVDYQDILHFTPSQTAPRSNELNKIRPAIFELLKQASHKKNSINLLDAENFIIPCIYLLETAGKKTLAKLFEFGSKQNHSASNAATSAAINVLLKKKLILKTPEGYVLSKAGLRKFNNWSFSSRTNYSYNYNDLDSIRIDVLSWRERSKTNQLFL